MEHPEKFRPYAAAYLVLIKNDKILLSRRANTGYQDGNYSLVAGHLDGGETVLQCITREATEEANIILSPQNLDVILTLHRQSPSDREYFDFYVGATNWTGEIKNMEPKKCDDLAWFDLANLPENILPDVKFALDQINAGNHFAEFGWPLK